MMFFTHMKIGFNQYWKARKNIDRQAFKLDPIRFIYGNIKPDISVMVMCKHHLSETYDYFIQHWNMVSDDSLSAGERSEALGVAAHFISDYFCLYHAKSPYNQNNLFEHFLYELKLHIYAEFTSLREMILGKEVTFTYDGLSHQSVTESLMDLLSDYYVGEESCHKDLSYTYTALGKLMESGLEKEETYANCHIHGHVFTTG